MLPTRFYLGCAVWAHRGWLGQFYPPHSQPRDFLRLYSQRLTTVEGNTTFYATPTPETVKRWASEMAPGFKFCPKLPKAITHQGNLVPYLNPALTFVALMQRLNPEQPSFTHLNLDTYHLGPIFAQLPPTYSPEFQDDLQTFLQGWPQDVALAIEVRHPRWFQPDAEEALLRLLTHRQVSRVILDSRPVYADDEDPQATSQRRKPQLPLTLAVSTSTVLVRFIGHPTLPNNQPFLAEWVERVRDWLEQGITIYFFVHCPDESRSPLILREFQTLLEQSQVPVPPLPWNQLPLGEAVTQLSLF